MAIGPAKAGPICLCSEQTLTCVLPTHEVGGEPVPTYSRINVDRMIRARNCGRGQPEIPSVKCLGAATPWRAREESLFGKRWPAILALIFAFSYLILGSNEAFAAAHGGGGGHRLAPTTSGFTLVLVDSTDGQAHWVQQVTFNVSTAATTEPDIVRRDVRKYGVRASAEAGCFYCL